MAEFDVAHLRIQSVDVVIVFLSQAFDHESSYLEGRRAATMVERVERNAEARQKCIKRYGASCAVCGFDFGKHHGEIGRDFIHVHHHRVQLADTRGEHKIDPINDLIPACPNCHAMIHRRAKMLSVDELRRIWSDHNPKL